MKQIPNLIRQFFYNIWNFRKIRTFKDFEKRLEDAVLDKQAEQVILMRKISKEMKKLFPKGRSEYIPLSLKERTEIRAQMYHRFGDEMRRLHVVLNLKLEFV